MPRKYTAEHLLNRRIRALERALEPFALEAGGWKGCNARFHPVISKPGEKVSFGRTNFTLGNLYRAERVLNGGYK